jgi:hypothetical protein
LTIHPSTEKTHSNLTEFNTHSFVIKIWLEVTPTENKKPSWRGHITHIPSGERRYVTTLFCMIAFIIRYLKNMGIKFGHFWWIKDWLTSRHFPVNELESDPNLLGTSSHVQDLKSN